MNSKKVLILDYSVDKSEAPAIKRWLPKDAQVTNLFIETEESFPDDLAEWDFTHVIHTGSSLSINDTSPFTKKAVRYIRKIRDKGVSQYGICFGHQLICLALVGKHAVRSSPNGYEGGWGAVSFTSYARKILGVEESECVWQSHFDEVIELPEGSELLATNAHTEIQAYINYEQKLLGTQFHPEFDRDAGNILFLEDRALFEKYCYDVDEIVKRGPSIDTGVIFFGFFLNQG
jgi:GMP synthase-like glutamine amidotransferase